MQPGSNVFGFIQSPIYHRTFVRKKIQLSIEPSIEVARQTSESAGAASKKRFFLRFFQRLTCKLRWNFRILAPPNAPLAVIFVYPQFNSFWHFQSEFGQSLQQLLANVLGEQFNGRITHWENLTIARWKNPTPILKRDLNFFAGAAPL